jgi:hypothetical protein
VKTPAVTEQTLLDGSWLALEQAGAMLRDSVRLYNAGSYANAVSLALLRNGWRGFTAADYTRRQAGEV